MRNRYLVTITPGEDRRRQRVFPSCAAAFAFCRGYVHDHVHASAVVLRRPALWPIAEFTATEEKQLPRISTAKPPRGGFASVIDTALRRVGFSTRMARRIRQAIFSCIIDALSKGEMVDTPIGSIKPFPHWLSCRWLAQNNGFWRWVEDISYRIRFEPAADLLEEEVGDAGEPPDPRLARVPFPRQQAVHLA